MNTPLGVIVTKASILKTLAKQRDALPEAVAVADDITRMAKNVSEIVHGLASVASRASTSWRPPASADRARRGKNCEPRLHRFSADLRLDLPEREVPVECYPVQIMQVLINLLNNAADASAERRERWVAVRLRAGNTRSLSVIDSGPGISSTVAEKIFTPFFTTKGDQDGTGIGLSLSRSIARRHNGDLMLDTESENTSFTLSLPLRQAQAARAAGSAHAPARKVEERGPVEDNPDLVESMRVLLELNGCSVRTFFRARDLLDWPGSHGSRRGHRLLPAGHERRRADQAAAQAPPAPARHAGHRLARGADPEVGALDRELRAAVQAGRLRGPVPAHRPPGSCGLN